MGVSTKKFSNSRQSGGLISARTAHSFPLGSSGHKGIPRIRTHTSPHTFGHPYPPPGSANMTADFPGFPTQEPRKPPERHPNKAGDYAHFVGFYQEKLRKCQPQGFTLNVIRITPLIRPRHSAKHRERADDGQRRAPKQQSGQFACAPSVTLYFREPSSAYFCTPKIESHPKTPDPRQ